MKTKGKRWLKSRGMASERNVGVKKTGRRVGIKGRGAASPAPSQVCGKRCLTAYSRPEIQVSGISPCEAESHQYQLSAEEISLGITNHLRCLGSPVWWDPESSEPGPPAC